MIKLNDEKPNKKRHQPWRDIFFNHADDIGSHTNGLAGSFAGAPAKTSGGVLFGLPLTTSLKFREEALMPSLKVPMLVAFISEKQSGLEAFAKSLLKITKAAGDKLGLIAMNVDKDQQIAAQLGIQAVPSVLVFERGQPLDGFVGALDEKQLRGFIERLIGKLPSPVNDILTEAKVAAADKRMAEAIRLYEEVLLAEPQNATARGALARIYIEAGTLETAKALLADLSKEAEKDADVIAARAALTLAETASNLGDIEKLQQTILANPEDWQARLDLALAQNAKNLRMEAANTLLDIIKVNRIWNEDGARRQLLQFFEAWGPMDSATKEARRKLSALLFR